ncbi:MAG: SprT-like domain-containing protein [Bowdeniella nasicola]|nr:SprT-like domain-containing protein [Bowdeniella nasicola]
MDLQELRIFAERLMRQEGLSGRRLARNWTFGFDRAKRRGGYCNYTRRHISVSRILMALYDDELAKDTVIHEVAHALAGAKAGHGPRWQAHARRLGGSAAVRLPADAPEPPPTWVGRCACGLVRNYHRRPAGGLMCPRCVERGFNPQLTWQHTKSSAIIITGPPPPTGGR